MITNFVEKIDIFQFKLDEKNILMRIGHKNKSNKIYDTLIDIIHEEKEKLNSLLHAAAVYKILDYSETNQHLIFKNADKVALSICTIGPGVESESTRLMKKNEMLRGLVVDALGSEAAEEAAEQVDKILCKKARKMDLWPSRRFSPGYKNWDIKEQKYIFQILPVEDIGVTLTKSYMMVPRKSVSFRINFYRDKKLSKRKINI